MNQPNDPVDVPSLLPAQYNPQQNVPSDAKDKAICDLTSACYQKASQLSLTKEEVAQLSADFNDDCFQPGAAGKENLIYIEHAALRERLDSVIGMGQWCMIPTMRRVEEFEYQKDEWINNRRTGKTIPVKGSHVYVDAILLIRGAFVASAIGEMTYYPDNHTQNYADAVEGAETAALRRCCKRLGVGLQAWRKDWCLGWWDRKNASKRTKPTVTTQKPSQDAPNPPAPPSSAPAQSAPLTAKEERYQAKCRVQLLNKLQAAVGGANRQLFKHFCMSKLWLKADQELEVLDFKHVPKSPDEFASLIEELHKFDMQQQQPEIVP